MVFKKLYRLQACQKARNIWLRYGTKKPPKQLRPNIAWLHGVTKMCHMLLYYTVAMQGMLYGIMHAIFISVCA
jgi:hypothetical protein